jgi:tetratricopeptide (TPR) repeat protein
VLSNLAHVALERDRTNAAREHVQAALPILEELGDELGRAYAYAILGGIELDEDRPEASRDAIDQAIRLARDVGATRSVALYLAFAGEAREVLGDRAAARRMYEESYEMSRRAGNELAQGLASAWLGRLLARADDVEGAERALDRAAEHLEHARDRVRWEVANLCRGHLELAMARAAEKAKDAVRADELRESARERAQLARARTEGTHFERSCDVRTALRQLDRDLRGEGLLDRPSQIPTEASAAPAAALVVHERDRWIRAPHAEPVSLRTRGSLWLLIDALARRRLEQTGRAATVDELFALGWPGEKALPRAAAARVYVAMSTLRGFGLRDQLMRRSDGYLLDPALTVVLTGA